MTTHYHLTPLEASEALAGHDLRTFKDWVAAATALLLKAPNWTALVEAGGDFYVVKTEFQGVLRICHTHRSENSAHVYRPDELTDFDCSAWAVDAWDGMDAESNAAALATPVFVTLRHY